MNAANDIAAALNRGRAPCLGMKGMRDLRVRRAIGVVGLMRISNLNDLKARFAARGVRVRPFRNIVYLTAALTIDETGLKKLTEASSTVVEQGV